MVWGNHPSLSVLEGPIWTSWSWGSSDFEAKLQEGRQAAELIRGWFPVRYGSPLNPADTTSARVSPMAEAAAHAARDNVDARVLWGDEPRAHLGNAGVDTGVSVPSLFDDRESVGGGGDGDDGGLPTGGSEGGGGQGRPGYG